MHPAKWALKTGLEDIRRHRRIVVFIFATNLVIAFVASIPLYTILQTRVGQTGFGREMSRGFDLVLWVDILAEGVAIFSPVVRQLLWAIPLILLLHAATGPGLIFALHTSNGRDFWKGMFRFTFPALGLAFLFFIAMGIWTVFVLILTSGLNMVWTGEIGTYRVIVVLLPVLMAAGVFLIDLMQDYARMLLVIGRAPIGQAWYDGIKWPFQHPTSIAIYLVWFVAAGVILVLPLLIDTANTAASLIGIWLLFLLQQLLLLFRAAVTVGWIGSEVAFYKKMGGPEYLEPVITEEIAVSTGLETPPSLREE